MRSMDYMRSQIIPELLAFASEVRHINTMRTMQ